MSGFQKQTTALRMRDIVKDIVKTTLDNERPSAIRGAVQSFDALNKTAQVLQMGETDPLSVTFNSANQPLFVGEVVELSGAPGNRYITNRISDPYTPSKLLGGGAIRWAVAANIGQLSWTQPFNVIISSLSTCPDGYFTITMPPDGSLVSTLSFVDPDYVWQTQTVAGGNIKLNAYETLYYALPLGSTNATDYTQFYIIGRKAPQSIPKHWIKICFYNFDGIANASPTADLGTGYSLDHWKVPTLINLWHDYGSGYYGVGYRKEGSYVQIRGAIAGGSGVMFNLPVGYRPQGGHLAFPANSVSGSTEVYGRVDVLTTGDVRALGGSTTLFTLNAVRFLAEQ